MKKNTKNNSMKKKSSYTSTKKKVSTQKKKTINVVTPTTQKTVTRLEMYRPTYDSDHFAIVRFNKVDLERALRNMQQTGAQEIGISLVKI